jgi:hypothetical protein
MNAWWDLENQSEGYRGLRLLVDISPLGVGVGMCVFKSTHPCILKLLYTNNNL